jgi:WD40 repeat protein
LVQAFKAHSSAINRIKQSPFNNLNSNYVATCSNDNTVKIWNVSSSSKWILIAKSNHLSSVDDLEWLDADTLASNGWGYQIFKIWSLSTGQTKREIQINVYVYCLKLLNTNIHLAAGHRNGDINIYKINDGNLSSSLKGHTSCVKDLVQISDDLLASSSEDYTVRIWNLTTNTCKFILTGHTKRVVGLKQITSSILASGSDDNKIILWDTSNGLEITNLTGHMIGIYWSLDLIDICGQTLVSGGIDGKIQKWNWKTGELLSTIDTGSNIFSLAVINLGEYFFSFLSNTWAVFFKRGSVYVITE